MLRAVLARGRARLPRWPLRRPAPAVGRAARELRHSLRHRRRRGRARARPQHALQQASLPALQLRRTALLLHGRCLCTRRQRHKLRLARCRLMVVLLLQLDCCWLLLLPLLMLWR